MKRTKTSGRARGGAVLVVFVASLPLTVLWTAPAVAKDFGYKTPSGRRIYEPGERFESLVDHRERVFVSEVVAGAAPEGNVGMLLGLLNVPIRRLDLFAGFGMEANPAYLATFSGRYTVHLWGFRPYLALGYLFKDTYAVGIRSHNAFAELGNTWVLHRTYRLSFGLGLRHRLGVNTTPGSLLHEPDVDPSLLQREIDDTAAWVPLLAVRFSRAF